MYTVQVAAEQYALDHKGTYPNAIDDVFKSYFAGGDCGLGRAIGRAPTNPFTNKTEWPLQGSITDIETARNAEPVEMKPGEIQYNALKDATSYAIIGGARDGKALHNDAGKIIILTNK